MILAGVLTLGMLIAGALADETISRTGELVADGAYPAQTAIASTSTS